MSLELERCLDEAFAGHGKARVWIYSAEACGDKPQPRQNELNPPVTIPAAQANPAPLSPPAPPQPL